MKVAQQTFLKQFTIFSPWIRRKSWNIMEDDVNYFYVHLNDYYPEIYKGEHPKKLKTKTVELYSLLTLTLFKDKLFSFINNIGTKTV